MVVVGGGGRWWEATGGHGRPQRPVPAHQFSPVSRIWSSTNTAGALTATLVWEISLNLFRRWPIRLEAFYSPNKLSIRGISGVARVLAVLRGNKIYKKYKLYNI